MNVQRHVAGLFVVEGQGARDLKGIAEPVRTLSDCPRERRPALWCPRPHPARRARGGARPLVSALAAGGERRGPARACGRRTRHRQVAPPRGVSPEARRRAAHLCRMVVVTVAAEYPAAPGRRMGPPALRRSRDACAPASHRPREHASADWPRPRRICAAPLLAPLVEIPLPEEHTANFSRQRNCGAGNWRRLSRGLSPGRDRSRSRSPSRTCTGPTQPRSI